MLLRAVPLALALALAACSKSDPPPPPKPKTAAAPAPAVPVPAPKSGEIDEALKERLARQEAAARMFEAKVLQPPPPKVPDPPPAAAKVQAPIPAPAAAQSAPPPGGAPAPRTELASAAPAPTPTAAPPRLVARVDPDFPREAVQAGADSGNVRARMTLDAAGGVIRVDILEATPRRVFDRAVVRALSQWRYAAGAEGRTVEMEVAFRR